MPEPSSGNEEPRPRGHFFISGWVGYRSSSVGDSRLSRRTVTPRAIQATLDLARQRATQDCARVTRIVLTPGSFVAALTRRHSAARCLRLKGTIYLPQCFGIGRR